MLDMLPASKIPDFDPRPSHASGLEFSPLANARTGTFRGGVALLTSDLQFCSRNGVKHGGLREIPNEIWRFQWENHRKIMEISLNIYKLCFFSASHP